MDKNIILKAINLTHSFDYMLFEDITLDLIIHKSIAIIGVSGSGKSTLLHILSSLLKPNMGEVIYNNQSLYDMKQSQILQIRRQDFGIIFQHHYLFRGFNGMENLYVSKLLSDNEIDIELLKRLKIFKKRLSLQQKIQNNNQNSLIRL